MSKQGQNILIRDMAFHVRPRYMHTCKHTYTLNCIIIHTYTHIYIHIHIHVNVHTNI